MHDVYRPLFHHFRKRRLVTFFKLFQITPETRVLDLGGTPYFWIFAQSEGYPLPKVTIVNLREGPKELPPGIDWIVCDGRILPFPDNSFDIVFSNSVIEHLGGSASQLQFAKEVQRSANKFFVQTPAREFLIEPHFIAPFIHWLPQKARTPLIRNFTVWGWVTRPTPEQCENLVAELKLLNRRELSRLFPNSQIIVERFMGWPKSLIAVRRESTAGVATFDWPAVAVQEQQQTTTS